jgi:hypothetical protein
MGDKISVEKVDSGKFGPYIKDTNQKFHSITEPVSNFLQGKVPAEIEVIEMDGKKISKVTVLSASRIETAKTFSNSNDPSIRINVDAGNLIQRAVELANALISKGELKATELKIVFPELVTMVTNEFISTKTNLLDADIEN